MEPNMDDIEDYKKPLSYKKFGTIVITFGIMILLYQLFVYLVSSSLHGLSL